MSGLHGWFSRCALSAPSGTTERCSSLSPIVEYTALKPCRKSARRNQFVFIFIKWYYGWCELWPWPCGITTASLILVLLNLDFACELELGSHSFDCFYLAVDLWSWFQWLYPRPWPTQPETFWFLTASWAVFRDMLLLLVLSKVLFLHSVMGTHLPRLS